RLFSSSRRSVDNTSPASQPGDIPSCVYESGAILEEEYQESFGMTAEHSESVPSILRKITPPRLSDPPPGGGATPTRHSAYVTSRGHRFATAAAIYNEPCDARRAGSSSGGSTSTFKRTALRRASLAASIYCDTEHHRQDVFQPPSSPQGSPDSLQLTSSNHLREGSGSAVFTVTNGWKNDVTSHMSQHWKEHDSGSSSLSNSRHGSSSKKHRKSRREGNSTEESPKPIKSMMQVFWRRHSSSSSNNPEKVATSPRTRTLSPSQSPLSRKTSAPAVSSLEQALRIARGQVEDEVGKIREKGESAAYDLTSEALAYQSPPPGRFLPRIPEHGEGNYSATQMEQLKASVVRRPNSRSDRSSFNSAPPGTYWPDGGTTPQPVISHQPQQQPQPQHHSPAFGLVERLPRIPPLSRPTSSVFFGGARSPVTSFCASPARTVSPTPFFHRPLPPPPPLVDRRGDKMSKSFNLGGSSGPMWHAIPPKSPTGEIEVIDTAVYSNVKIPLLRMASPPAGSGSSTGHSPLAHTGGSMRVHSQSPPPPTTQPQLVARDHRQRQQQAPLAHTSSSPGLERRRNFSPRQQTTATTTAATTAASSSHSASPTLSNSPSFSNHPVVLQGNTQISHHPASPFAPIARTTSCGSRTSPSAASAAAATASSLRSNSDVTAPTRPCAQSYHRPAVSPPPEHQRAICSPCASASNSSAVRQIPDDGESDGVQSTSGGPQPSRRRKDLAATYEEAWDVKMSRRLGGMDVSRLAEALPNSNFKRYDLVRASDRPLRSPATPAPVVRSPSLSPVLTSTEGIVMRQPRPAPRASFRNSSTDTVINREMMPSPFRLKQNRVASPTMNLSISPSVKEGPASPSASAAPVTDYDYAYNRSWSMGVQLNLSLNLASNTDGSADQRVGPMAVEVGEKPVLSISGASSPPPPPPHRSASIMTPTTTQFSPPQSPTPMRRQCAIPHVTADVGVGMSPPSSRARGVHNPLASGVPIPLTPSSPPSEESSSTMRGDTSDAASTAATVAVPGLLPHMSRLLADWDNMSTDSCEEPWDVRHGKVISQLTSSRFIDPSEVLSAVANENHNGAATGASGGGVSNGHSEGRVAAGLVMDGEGAVPMSPSSNISQPISCPSPHARSPSDVKTQNCLKPLNEQPWFHPNLTRFGAEKRLRSEPEGSFLVRNSETLKNEYSLTVKHNGFLHMRITRDAQGQFVLGEYSQPYPSIPHMISHYEQTQVPVKGADSVTLCHPR
uniref:SH2 domain-containing protein n=1 Tax=Echinococcus canadensis TaxID=519352 RepID=A0A915EZX7_9CEST